MMKKATCEEFQVIIGWKLDRLCRSLADLVNVERTLRNHGVQLCTVTEVIDTSSSVGRFNFRNLASVAELEREMIGERSRLGLFALAREGKWPNGQPPLGYYKDNDGRLRIDRVEARTVRAMFRIYLKEKSLDQVAFWLNSKEITTKRGSISSWNARAVRDILTNPIYVGKFAVAGYMEGIPNLRLVESRVFNKASQLMRRYSSENSKRHPMPMQRKQAKLHKVITRYLEFVESFA
jgi:site-specific DNA recombinase